MDWGMKTESERTTDSIKSSLKDIGDGKDTAEVREESLHAGCVIREDMIAFSQASSPCPPQKGTGRTGRGRQSQVLSQG